MNPKYLIVLAFSTVPVSAQTLQERAAEIQARLQRIRSRPEGEPPGFIFGSFPLEEVVPVEEVKTDALPVAVVETVQPPSFKCKGTLMIRGRRQVITQKGGFFVGDKVDGYEIVEITQTDVTCRKGGKTFTIPAR